MVSKDEFVETLRSNEIATGKEEQHFEAFCEDFGADGESHVNFRDYWCTRPPVSVFSRWAALLTPMALCSRWRGFKTPAAN